MSNRDTFISLQRIPGLRTQKNGLAAFRKIGLRLNEADRPSNANKPVPELMRLGTNGEMDPEGLQVAFVQAPFQFCLNPDCRVAYNARQSSDVGKLSTIGVDGRSTATTILAYRRFSSFASMSRSNRKQESC